MGKHLRRIESWYIMNMSRQIDSSDLGYPLSMRSLYTKEDHGADLVDNIYAVHLLNTVALASYNIYGSRYLLVITWTCIFFQATIKDVYGMMQGKYLRLLINLPTS